MLPMGKLSSRKNANAKFLQLRATEWAVGFSDGAISGGSSAALISAGFGLSRPQQPECRPSASTVLWLELAQRLYQLGIWRRRYGFRRPFRWCHTGWWQCCLDLRGLRAMRLQRPERFARVHEPSLTMFDLF